MIEVEIEVVIEVEIEVEAELLGSGREECAVDKRIDEEEEEEEGNEEVLARVEEVVVGESSFLIWTSFAAVTTDESLCGEEIGEREDEDACNTATPAA